MPYMLGLVCLKNRHVWFLLFASTHNKKMWNSLNIDIRCKILSHMDANDRMKMWVVAGEKATIGRILHSEHVHDVRYIARMWASIGRDASIEAAMEDIVGVCTMICSATYQGFEYKGRHGKSEIENVPLMLRASWAAAGSQTKMLLQLICEMPSGATFDDIWLPIVDNDDEAMAKLLLSIRATPSRRACWHMGRTGAPKVAKAVLHDVDACNAEHIKTILSGCVHADRDVSGPFRVTDIIAKCMFREILGLKGHMLAFNDLADILDVIIARKALLKNEGTGANFEYMWFTQFLLEEYSVHGPHHSQLLSYFAGHVIRLHDEELLHYIIHASVEWGLWTLTETMLWTACAHGTAMAVEALLGVPNIAAEVSPPAYFWAVQNESEIERAAIVTCLRAAYVPIQDDTNDSGLEAAVLIDNPSIALSFLEWGADVTLRAFGRCRSAEMRALLKMYVPPDRLSEFEANARYELCGRELPAHATYGH
jgi:hypothetical protein